MLVDPLNIKTIGDEDDVEMEEELDEGFSATFDMFAPAIKIEPESEDDIDVQVETDDDSEEEEAPGEFDSEELSEDDETSDETLDDKIRDRPKKVKSKPIQDYFEEMEMEAGPDSFMALNLSRPILKAVAQLGFVSPTQIQSLAIPLGIKGRDLCGSAVTGSGKTAAFMIPILERLIHRPKQVAVTRVLILVPTRELGVQCLEVAQNLSRFTDIQHCLLVGTFEIILGGLPTKIQEIELRKRPDIIIATPGRLIDHIHNSASFSLDSIEILVIDEADRILEDGFAAELNEIIKYTPKSRQTMLFSATMTDNINDLIRLSLNRPVRLFVDNNTSITDKLVQEFVRVRENKEESRPAVLAALCSRTYTRSVIVFFRSKAAAHHMKILFSLLGLKAVELHGNLTQAQRLEAMETFKKGKAQFLLATDLASRGLDINGIQTVINYDMPKNYAVYVHRVGRTARGNKGGCAVSLVGEADRTILKLAVKNARGAVKNRVIPSAAIAKFHNKLADLDGKVKAIYEQEKDDKEMQKAEMELTKASNILEHAAEIASRPARVWFQTETEKQDQKTLVVQKKKVVVEPKKKMERSKLDGLSRKKKRRLQDREEDEKDLRAQKFVAKRAKSTHLPEKMAQFNSASKSFSSSKSSSAPKKGNKSQRKHALKTRKR